MKHESVTEEVQENAALYALGAFSQLEARSFENHLQEGCSVCLQEVAQFENVTDQLGFSAEADAPPAYLRDVLAARIEKESQDSGVVIPFPKPELKQQIVPPSEREIAREIPREAVRRPARWGVVLPWAIAASLLIAGLVGFTLWQAERRNWQDTIARQASEADESERERAQLQEQLVLESEKSRQLAQINEAISSPGMVVIKLAGLQAAPQSSAKIYWDIQRSRWVVTADLPPAPEGKTYQLWFLTQSAKVSAGLIKATPTGQGFAVLDVPPNLGQVNAAAITLEPEGGSAQPTLPIYALGATG